MQSSIQANMKSSIRSLLAYSAVALGGLFLLPATVTAHCQIPCGIYDDHARVKSMFEDADTVAKAVVQIQELAGKTDAQSQQQLVRWVTNKEAHAQKIIETISDYYLTQRVKPSQPDYGERLVRHHAVILSAMKAKQQADEAVVEELVERIEALKEYYPHHMH